MSFEDEWAQCKAAAADKQAMQLNRLPDEDRPTPAPENGDLAVDQKDLAAVGDAAYDLRARMGKDMDHANETTQSASMALTDLALGPALGNLANEWIIQAAPLRTALAHISNHLDYTKNAHAGDEEAIATSFSILQLDGGFNEGTQLK